MVYRQDLVQLVSEREFEAFGVRVGPRIEEVEENVEAELADIRALLERQKQAPPEERERITQDLAAKVEQLGENVSREVQQIRQLEEAPPRPAARRAEAREPAAAAGGRAEAAELERRGFEALIAGDKEAALAAIDRAWQLWPDYHNLAELRRLLRSYGDRLDDPRSPAWQEVYRRILTDYSWGMSKEHRAALREKLY